MNTPPPDPAAICCGLPSMGYPAQHTNPHSASAACLTLVYRKARSSEVIDAAENAAVAPAGVARSAADAVTWQNYAAVACAALGDRTSARRLTQDAAEVARANADPRLLAAALLTRAVVSGEVGRPTLDRAITLFHAYPADGVRVGAHHRLPGCHGTDMGPRAHGLAHLRLAGYEMLASLLERLEWLERLEARPWGRSDAGRPTTEQERNATEPLGMEALTPHEYRLARLAIEGRTNDDIAKVLSVSRRTVEFHFTNIYRKLGIDRRVQLFPAMWAATQLSGPSISDTRSGITLKQLEF